MTSHADWRMPQGRGLLSGCGAHDQTVGQRADEGNPASEEGSTAAGITSSAHCSAAVPRFPRDGSILVRKSMHPSKPYYLQVVINDWEKTRYWGRHALIGEDFATREEAEARARELRRG